MNVSEYSVFNRQIYYAAWVHALMLFLIYLPPDKIKIPLFSQLHKFYVDWLSIILMFIYLVLAAFLRYNYFYHKTLKNKRMYLINYLAIVLAVCIEFWITNFEKPEALGGGPVDTNFKCLLFIGFVFLLPVTLLLKSTIILPFLIGYRVVFLFGIKREKSETFFEREEINKQEEEDHWKYVLNPPPHSKSLNP